MINPDIAKEYLSSLGINPPEIVIVSWLGIIESLDECFEANGYSDEAQTLIGMYLVALYGLSAGNMYISSQSAPSGASRSFRFAQLNEAYRGQLALLRMLDPKGCTNSLIPDNPTVTKKTALMIGRGGCYE